MQPREYCVYLLIEVHGFKFKDFVINCAKNSLLSIEVTMLSMTETATVIVL